jgi:structural maintenance of chromosome 2
MGKIHVSVWLSCVLAYWLCRDFGSVFAELLTGNFAKAQPPEGQDLMQVKVQLGSVSKQSLTELSGGQRKVASSSRY